MSKLFYCGQSGCSVLIIDDEAREYAMAKTKEWAWQQKSKRGEFPSIEEKSEIIEEHYNRYNNIHFQPRNAD